MNLLVLPYSGQAPLPRLPHWDETRVKENTCSDLFVSFARLQEETSVASFRKCGKARCGGSILFTLVVAQGNPAQHRYADSMDAKRHGYQHGYRDGLRQGRADMSRNMRYNYESDDYRRCDRSRTCPLGAIKLVQTLPKPSTQIAEGWTCLESPWKSCFVG